MVERRENGRAEEDERERHREAGQRESDVGEALQEGRRPSRVARAEQRDGRRAYRRRPRRERRYVDGVERVRPKQVERLARRNAANDPVTQHGHRRRERKRDDAPGERRGRPSPTSQPDDLRLALRARRRPVVRGAASGAALRDEQRERQPRERERERGGDAPVERGLVLNENRPRERLIAQQRDRPEVAQRVERDEQRSGDDGRPQERQRDVKERAARAPPQASGGLLRRGVYAAERGFHGQRHVGEGEQNERERRARQSKQRRQPLHAQRLEPALQHSFRAERGDHEQREDVTRNGERQRGQDAERAAERQVGPERQPCQRNAQDGARGGYDADEDDGADEDGQRPPAEQNVQRRRPRLRRADEQVDGRQQHQERDGGGGQPDERGRPGAGAVAPSHRRGVCGVLHRR